MRYLFYLMIDAKSKDLVLYDRLEGCELYRCIGFLSMYNFILKEKLDFNKIRLNLTFKELFNHFVDEGSLNPDKKEGRI